MILIFISSIFIYMEWIPINVLNINYISTRKVFSLFNCCNFPYIICAIFRRSISFLIVVSSIVLIVSVSCLLIWFYIIFLVFVVWRGVIICTCFVFWIILLGIIFYFSFVLWSDLLLDSLSEELSLLHAPKTNVPVNRRIKNFFTLKYSFK